MIPSDNGIPDSWPPPPPKKPRQGSGSQGIPDIPPFAVPLILLGLIVGGMLFLVLTGRAGIVNIADTEVAVIVNYMTGEEEVIRTPGVAFFIPWLNDAYVMDKSPNEFEMTGERDLDYNHVQELEVRASDGSKFRFDSLSLQYQLIPGDAALVLQDSGPGESFKRNWVRAFARAVLRDEFGRYSSEAIADPSNYMTATSESKIRLNKFLNPHGIEILQIITPKPIFVAEVEKAIEDRKNANQEVERLRIEQTKLVNELDRKLAETERTKASEYEQAIGILGADKINAEKEQVKVEKSADAFKISQINAGKAEQLKKEAEARALENSAIKSAEGLVARTKALEKQGEILVREELSRLFQRVRFSVVPYRRDSSPVRVEHLLPPSSGNDSQGIPELKGNRR
ncbi:MAG: SPFH domain-containing protein [Planctomycetota bacterium]|nr:SPFH domain-containing protein [Planctomycetota bacterium]